MLAVPWFHARPSSTSAAWIPRSGRRTWDANHTWKPTTKRDWVQQQNRDLVITNPPYKFIIIHPFSVQSFWVPNLWHCCRCRVFIRLRHLWAQVCGTLLSGGKKNDVLPGPRKEAMTQIQQKWTQLEQETNANAKGNRCLVLSWWKSIANLFFRCLFYCIRSFWDA